MIFAKFVENRARDNDRIPAASQPASRQASVRPHLKFILPGGETRWCFAAGGTDLVTLTGLIMNFQEEATDRSGTKPGNERIPGTNDQLCITGARVAR